MKFVSRLSETQIRQTQEDSQSLWGDGASFEERLSNLTKLLSYGPENLRVSGLELDGKIVASLKRYRMAFQTNLGIIPTIGIGAVFTPENERRKGYAAELTKAALAEAKHEGFSGALLFSDIAPEYYEQFGFKRFPLKLATTDVKYISHMTTKVRIAVPGDEAILMKLRELHRPVDRFVTKYDAKTFTLFRNRNIREPAHILTDGQNDIGYVSVGNGKDALWAEEISVPKSHLLETWNYLKTIARERNFEIIKGWLREDQTLSSEAKWSPVKKPVPMFAILSKDFGDLKTDHISVDSLDYF